jgi:hypothetical protein
MKRMTCFVMALALVLGLAQCKKEKLETPQNEGNSVMITLDVKGDNNAKVDVNPPDVTFEYGDEIIVACNGHYVGTLTHNGTNFSGPIENATPDQPLYFYFFGNKTPQFFGEGQSNCSVCIGEQTGDLPVISMGQSKQTFPSSGHVYTAILQNKCSLMKFNVETPSTAPICISGMNNFVTVSFDRSGNDGYIDGFKYSQVYDGVIKMHGVTTGNTETWAIVLPQASVAEGSAYTEDGYIGTRPAIEGGIGINQYYNSDGVALTMESYNPLTIPLTFEAITAGATVSLNRAGTAASSAPEVSLEISTDGISWTTYKVDSTITLTNVGDKVMFRGTNARYATGTSAYHNFSLGGDCYVYGNIMSLINATDYATLGSLDSNAEYIFESLFHGCTGLHTHSVKTLDLPATELAPYCYSYMFSGCTNLTKAPALDAEVLKEGCYQGMFESCTSLEVSPELSASSLVSNCYANMFKGCSRLSRVICFAYVNIYSPGLISGVGNIDYLNTYNWLSGVANTGTFVMSAIFDEEAGECDWPRGENGIPTRWIIEP